MNHGTISVSWNVNARERMPILRLYLLRALLGAPPECGEGPLPRRDHVQEVHLRSEEQHPGVEFPAGATETQVEHGGGPHQRPTYKFKVHSFTCSILHESWNVV